MSRRGRGDGLIHQRPDGRWEARVEIGWKERPSRSKIDLRPNAGGGRKGAAGCSDNPRLPGGFKEARLCAKQRLGGVDDAALSVKP